VTEHPKKTTSPYDKLFENHPWLAHFLVTVIKRILGIFNRWIDDEAKPRLKE
jgi:hypothetical protein